jgi:HEAT repeat protein
LVGLALSAALALADAARNLLSDAIERAPEADLSGFFGLARRYGQLDLVLEVLNDPRARVREVAAATLRWIHDERVVAPLERAIEDPDPGVRSAAAISLQSMKEWGATTFSPLALDAAQHPHPSLIRLLLDHNPTPKDLPEILAALNNFGIPAKLRAAIAFKAVPIFAAFPENLVEMLRQRTEWPSVELLAALGKLGDRRVVPFLLRYTDSIEWNSPSALCYALAEIGGDEAARALTRLLVAQKNRAAAAALKRMGRAAAPYVLEAYRESSLVRQQHAELLVAVAGEDALPALITALHDTDHAVRVNAEFGLCALGEVKRAPVAGPSPADRSFPARTVGSWRGWRGYFPITPLYWHDPKSTSPCGGATAIATIVI